MEEELTETLVKVGLTDGESRTYLALLTIGTSTVGSIIEKSDVSASKVYTILNRLVHKGLVTMFVENKKKFFTASDPELILQYLEDEKKRLDKNEEEINKILPTLKSRKETVSKLPFVEYSKGVKGFETLHKKSLEEIKPGQFVLSLAGKEASFRLKHYWYKDNLMTSELKIPQHLIYEHDVWFKKDPKVHRRKERKMYYPYVLDKKFRDLPNIRTIGSVTIITGFDKDEIYTLLIRNENLTESFRKLLLIIRDQTVVPEGFEKKELKFRPF
ncbi:MAG: helix-turn-helix domain-containing protein [Candidatus Woesearchaeota archaeon]